MSKKNILVILFFWACNSSYAQWHKLPISDSPSYCGWHYNMQFIDKDTGFIFKYVYKKPNVLVKTVDGGNTVSEVIDSFYDPLGKQVSMWFFTGKEGILSYNLTKTRRLVFIIQRMEAELEIVLKEQLIYIILFL